MHTKKLVELIASELPRVMVKDYAVEMERGDHLSKGEAVPADAACLLMMAGMGESESQSALTSAMMVSHMRCMDVVLDHDGEDKPHLAESELATICGSLTMPFGVFLSCLIQALRTGDSEVRIVALTLCRNRHLGLIEFEFPCECGETTTARVIFAKGEKSAFEEGGPARGSVPLTVEGMDILATINGEIVHKIAAALGKPRRRARVVRNAKNLDELKAAWPVALDSRQIGVNPERTEDA